MGFISFQKLCFVLFFILLTCYYISAFRLIHTSQQSHEIKVKPDKETVKKIDEINDEIMSLKEKFRNQTNKIQHKSPEKEVRIKTKIISDKKVIPMQPTLPEITKEKIMRAKLTKSETTDDSAEEEKPKPTLKEEPERKIKIEEHKEPSQIVKKEDFVKKVLAPILKEEHKVPEEKKIEAAKPKQERKIEVAKPKEEKKIEAYKEPSQIVKKEDFVKKVLAPILKEEQKVSEEKKIEAAKPKEERKKEVAKPKEENKIEAHKEPLQIVKKEDFVKKVLAPLLKEETKTPEVKKIEAVKPKEPILPKEPQKIITKKIETITKPKQEKIEPKKTIEEKKMQIAKPKEEKKVEMIKPKEVKKVDVTKDVKKTEIIKEKTTETKSKPKSEQTKELPKNEPEHPAKKEELKPVKTKTVFDSSVTSLYFNLPSFSPNFDIVDNEECKKQGHILIDQLKNKKMWALKMFDATAKIPSGILKGNLNQLGDYDQCVGIFTKIPIDDEKEEVKITGKYCLADIDFEAEIQEMKLPVHLAQSRALIRSKLQDPGHFIPRFTTIRWGLCIPSGCSAEDAERILEDSIRTYNESNSIGINLDVSIKPDQCYVRKAPKKLLDYHYTTLGTLALTASIGLLVLIATLRDTRLLETETNDNEKITEKQESKMEKILMTFSLKRTVTSFLRQGSDSDEIECIHGIRTICTFTLYIAHKLIPIGHLPFTNKAMLTEISNNPLSTILRLSVIYTDSFLLLSGILTSYSMSKDMETKGRIPWFNRMVARFIRLTPSLIFVLLYYAYVLEIFGEGPLWGTVISENVKLCKESWWRNMFYIQNLYPFQEMCATHTHQLALDMQLSLIAPILVWLLYKRPLLGISTTVMLHLISVILRYYTTMNYRLSLVIYHGISISQLYRTANMLYASSVHRATPYIAGVGLGVLLRQIKSNCQVPKILLLLGWLVAGYFATWALYTPSHLSSRTYKYDINEAAQFSALCSLAWALALSWLIFYCFVDKQGYLNSILSSRPMVILSKISYTLYLTQFIVFFYNVGTIRTPTEFTINSSLDVIELAIIIVISTLLTLLVDMPVQKIKTIILKSTPIAEESKSSPETDGIKDKIGNALENVKKVTISANVEILDDNEIINEELYHKYRQLSTESEPVSEDFTEDIEEIYDEDEEIVDKLENKMRQFSTESEPVSEPISEDNEELLEDEEIVENLENRMRQSSVESQPSLEDVEEIVYDDDIEENVEKKTRQLTIQSQYSTDEVEDIEQDEEIVETIDSTARDSFLQSQYSTEEIEEMEYNEENVEDETLPALIKSQFTTEDVKKVQYDDEIQEYVEDKTTLSQQPTEDIGEKVKEDEEAVVERFVFRIRPTSTRTYESSEDIDKTAEADRTTEADKTAEDDEEIVRNLENNVRQSAAENEPLSQFQHLNDDE